MRSERSERQARREPAQARAEAAAALIFDPAQSAFVWANSAGLALFGVKSIARLTQDRLDRALPAAARLIAFAEEAEGIPRAMSLDFWTARGPVHIEAVAERLALSRDKTGVLIRSGSTLADLPVTPSLRPDRDAAAADARTLTVVKTQTTAPPSVAPEATPQCLQSTALSQEEEATLREIARLIREGELTELPDLPYSSPAETTSEDETSISASVETSARASEDASPALLPQADSDAMRLLAEVSHELRTPLTAVRGFGELIAANPSDAKVADRARHIVDAADHMLSLIGDLIDVRQLASGEAGIVFTDVNLAVELEQAAAMVAPQAAKAGVVLIATPSLDLPKVVADARRVRQVLVNLAANAVKFTGPGGVVRLGAIYAPDGGVEVSVSDTGRGMGPAEVGDRDAVLVRRRRGIGLPLSRALAEANGARLHIESKPGAGTVAHLSFPASSVVPP